MSPENLRLVITGRYCINTVKQGFQLADMDILYIKMLEIARSSISFDKKKWVAPENLKLVFYPLIWYFGKNGATKFGKYGHMIHQNAGNRAPVDLV